MTIVVCIGDFPVGTVHQPRFGSNASFGAVARPIVTEIAAEERQLGWRVSFRRLAYPAAGS